MTIVPLSPQPTAGSDPRLPTSATELLVGLVPLGEDRRQRDREGHGVCLDVGERPRARAGLELAHDAWLDLGKLGKGFEIEVGCATQLGETTSELLRSRMESLGDGHPNRIDRQVARDKGTKRAPVRGVMREDHPNAHVRDPWDGLKMLSSGRSA